MPLLQKDLADIARFLEAYPQLRPLTSPPSQTICLQFCWGSLAKSCKTHLILL